MNPSKPDDTVALLPSEKHLPALADDRILLRTFLLNHGPQPSWQIRRVLGFGEFRFRRAIGNPDWFVRHVGEWCLTDEGISDLSAQALPATIPPKEPT